MVIGVPNLKELVGEEIFKVPASETLPVTLVRGVPAEETWIR
jgi:hypothetical protein